MEVKKIEINSEIEDTGKQTPKPLHGLAIS